jgi:hypothetical protein
MPVYLHLCLTRLPSSRSVVSWEADRGLCTTAVAEHYLLADDDYKDAFCVHEV